SKVPSRARRKLLLLYGDPTKPSLFVSRVKFSAGWKDPPHWHPDEVRTVVVLSGTLYFGSGDKWDETKFMAYAANAERTDTIACSRGGIERAPRSEGSKPRDRSGP